MSPTTGIIIALIAVGGIYALKQYQAAKAKESAAGEWNFVIGGATKLIGLL